MSVTTPEVTDTVPCLNRTPPLPQAYLPQPARDSAINFLPDFLSLYYYFRFLQTESGRVRWHMLWNIFINQLIEYLIRIHEVIYNFTRKTLIVVLDEDKDNLCRDRQRGIQYHKKVWWNTRRELTWNECSVCM